MSSSRTIASNFTVYNWKNILTMAGISLGYLLLSYLLIGFRSEQLFLVGLVNVFYFLSLKTRKFIIGFSIFIIYWIIFDYMKAFPNYLFNDVHIGDLHNAELSLFGISVGGKLLTPNEYFLIHQHSFFDVVAGIFYLCWIPVPLLFATYLFYTNREQFIRFSLTFLLVNLLGFVVYYIYPAAPPWYIQQHGYDFIAGTPGNTAGLARFDAFFNVHIFEGLYTKGSNVFAAMPSLHSAYPTIVFYYALRNRLGLFNILFAVIMAGIWCAAVYTSHHYVLDVLCGISCALCGIALFNALLRNRKFNTSVKKLIAATE